VASELELIKNRHKLNIQINTTRQTLSKHPDVNSRGAAAPAMRIAEDPDTKEHGAEEGLRGDEANQ
jgi:hypothetical protein